MRQLLKFFSKDKERKIRLVREQQIRSLLLDAVIIMDYRGLSMPENRRALSNKQWDKLREKIRKAHIEAGGNL